ncbi:nicotinate-nucleotide adenylyltransferase [Thermosulfurimonas sp. F29]|uniref:nicotinate-nucleotide adenylyltransferase n=1 Tax=Thermosulfurimonas sp. F29 TaxID=2867247 RepID=UPI001C8305D7|nr:nicotinate-nucleotide adenylyltransferase [Thermosulfurimonas sp. F29]MBX6422255.1 nicotinate-nucleotide adenylyltransferase [Thermosulfurimonas sp. F29]
MRVGLLGGTFDPIHLGHLRVAEEVREKLDLSEVWFIPAGVPPHKRSEPHLPFEERLRLVRLAVEEHPAFRVLDLEGRRSGPSYTVDTLEELRRRHPDHDYFFILGLDAFVEIETWHEFRRLPELATLVVVNRGDLDLESARNLSKRLFPGREVLFLQVRRLDISSTEIRRLRRSGRSIRYLVPEAVRRRIEERGHYL